MSAREVDALVVGSGFGGLGAALHLAERGRSVQLHERLRYPGGCAGSFERHGRLHEAGATLFSGLGPEQLFGRWIAKHALPVTVDWIDPLVEFRAPGRVLTAGRDRALLVEQLCALPGAPARALRAFFAEQRRAADLLWELLDDPSLLPPFDLRALGRHAARLPRWLPLLRVVGRPLMAVLARHGLAGFRPLVDYLDALCRITVQCGVREAEAPFALAVMDYYHRGTGHVRGGIGELAWALARAVERLGGELRFADAVQSASPAPGGGWLVRSRSGETRCRALLLNLLPADAAALLAGGGTRLPRLERGLARAAARVAEGWGACLLHLVARAPAGVDEQAHHLQLVQDLDAPYIEGNHLFCSISGAADTRHAPPGHRALTVSTHVRPQLLAARDEAGRAAYMAGVQQRLRDGLAALAPEWWSGVTEELTASPRTFERFTGRHDGYVGGVPRRAGLRPYLSLFAAPRAAGLHLVGDSFFPGQSTLAAALGGVRTAERVLRG